MISAGRGRDARKAFKLALIIQVSHRSTLLFALSHNFLLRLSACLESVLFVALAVAAVEEVETNSKEEAPGGWWSAKGVKPILVVII